MSSPQDDQTAVTERDNEKFDYFLDRLIISYCIFNINPFRNWVLFSALLENWKTLLYLKQEYKNLNLGISKQGFFGFVTLRFGKFGDPKVHTFT